MCFPFGLQLCLGTNKVRLTTIEWDFSIKKSVSSIVIYVMFLYLNRDRMGRDTNNYELIMEVNLDYKNGKDQVKLS
jgi:hypothetical protein